MKNYTRKQPWALALVLLLCGCTTVNSKVGSMLSLDTDLEIAFQVSSDINPDDREVPSPLFVRMYELKSPKLFKKADFIAIFERDKEALGADMLDKQRLKRLKPGEGRSESFVLNEDTEYVGLYAEFFQYKNANFKVVIPVVKNNVVSTDVTVRIAGNRMTVVN